VPGFARVLARRARPLVERVRALDWSDGPPAVLGAELSASASVPVAGEPRALHFQADRVDRLGDALRFTDYKTGRPLADQLKLAYREAAQLRDLARGRQLQAMAYARAGGPGCEGRYLQLDERAPDPAVALSVRDVPPWSGLFDATAAQLFEAWEAGSFFPRLSDASSGDEPGSCRSCEVKQACLRGDSGARRRLGRFADAPAEGSGPVATARSLYRLGREEA
jgi:hypothetical protein